jgi:predicted glycosyltransferase
LKEYTDDMMAYLDAANLVVSMGGYNTVCEILTLKKRAIVVPRVTPVEEQWIRARRMAKRGLFRFIHPDKVSPNSIMTMVNEEIAKPSCLHESHKGVDMGGLPRIADFILSMIGEKQEIAKKLCFKVIRHQKLLEYKKSFGKDLYMDGWTGSQLSNS